MDVTHLEEATGSQRRLLPYLVGGAAVLALVFTAVDRAWAWSASRGAVEGATRYVDAVLTGRTDEVFRLRSHPVFWGDGPAGNLVAGQSRKMRALSSCPLLEFCGRKVAEAQVTILGPTTVGSKMQSRPDGGNEPVVEVPVRYRVTIDGKFHSFDLVMHGHRSSNQQWEGVRWYVFNVAPLWNQ